MNTPVASMHDVHAPPIIAIGAPHWTVSRCDVGAVGSLGVFNPGPGSWIFIAAPHDGAAEGSYGLVSDGIERVPANGITRAAEQDLSESWGRLP